MNCYLLKLSGALDVGTAGTLYTCSECEYRAFCEECLNITNDNFEHFVCPVCFLGTAEAKANKTGNPYMVIISDV